MSEWPDQYPGAQLSEDRGYLEEPLAHLAAKLRREQYHRELEDQPYDRLRAMLQFQLPSSEYLALIVCGEHRREL